MVSLEDGGASASNEGSDTPSTRATLDREQQEIRALIEELDRVRHRSAPPRVSSDYDPLDSAITEDEQQHRHPNSSHGGHGEPLQALGGGVGVQMLSVEADSLAMVGGGETDHSVMEGGLSTAEGYASTSAMMSTGGADVVVPRSKLDLMLRAAQETLRVQKKLLEDVRAIEQRLAGYR